MVKRLLKDHFINSILGLSKSKILFIFSLCISVSISYYFYNKINVSQKEIHSLYLEKFKNDAENVFQNYINPLNGIASAYHISPSHFNNLSFQASALTRDNFYDFTGALGFGFIRRVKPVELENYLAEQRKRRPDFNLKRLNNESNSKDLFVIEMIEPYSPNEKAIGLVVSDEINRRQAAEEAMKTGMPVITQSIQLVQIKNSEPGYLLFRPIYETPKTPDSEKARIEKLVGWSYAPILASSIVSDIKRKNPFLQIVEIDEVSQDGLSKSIFKDKQIKTNNDMKHFMINVTNKKWKFSVNLKSEIAWSSELKAILLLTILSSVSTIVYFYHRQVEMKSSFESQLLSETQSQVSKFRSELIESQKNEKLQQAKLYSNSKLSLLGEMAGGIAHEINNPLAIIDGKSSLIRMKIKKEVLSNELKETLDKNIQDIHSTVDRINSIVKGLRSFCRDSENEPFQMARFADIFSTVENIMTERIKSKNIRLEIKSDLINSFVYCNKVQIEQIILNLLSNSIYAIEKSDDRWIKILVEKDVHFYKIRIVDSGNGISNEISEKMMQPFFTTKPVGHGTGLGLSICRGIIEKHQGNFDYELYQGKTSFILHLPIVGEDDEKKSA